MTKKMICSTCLRTPQECRDKKYGNLSFDGVKNICGYGKWKEDELKNNTASSGSTEVDEDDPHWQQYWKYFQDKSGQQTYLKDWSPKIYPRDMSQLTDVKTGKAILGCDTPIAGCDEYQCKTCGCNRKYNDI